jgi:hypothetical protein
MLHTWYIGVIVALLLAATVALNLAPVLAGCGTRGC